MGIDRQERTWHCVKVNQTDKENNVVSGNSIVTLITMILNLYLGCGLRVAQPFSVITIKVWFSSPKKYMNTTAINTFSLRTATHPEA